MDCKEIQRLILDYIDRELPTTLIGAIDDHITECPECREEVKAHRRLNAMLQLRTVPVPDAPYFDSMWDRISAEIPARVVEMPMQVAGSADAGNGTAPKKRLNRFGLVAVAAAIVLLVASSAFYATLPGEQTAENFDQQISLGVLPNAPAGPMGQVLPSVEPEDDLSAMFRSATGASEPLGLRPPAQDQTNQ